MTETIGITLSDIVAVTETVGVTLSDIVAVTETVGVTLDETDPPIGLTVKTGLRVKDEDSDTDGVIDTVGVFEKELVGLLLGVAPVLIAGLEVIDTVGVLLSETPGVIVGVTLGVSEIVGVEVTLGVVVGLEEDEGVTDPEGV